MLSVETHKPVERCTNFHMSTSTISLEMTIEAHVFCVIAKRCRAPELSRSAVPSSMHSAARSLAPSPLPRQSILCSHGGPIHLPRERHRVSRLRSVPAFRLGFDESRKRRSAVARIGTKAVGLVAARELQDEADFASVANGNGEISICGFGSLLSERSALSTFPNLRNFRVAVLRDFRRVFAHIAPVFLDRGIANIETKELSSLSVEPCVGESIVVTVFEIPVAEVPAFIEREHEFRFLAVPVEGQDGEPFSQRAVVCARYSDEEYRRVRCQGSSNEYHKRYGKYDIQQIWLDDIFPCRVYLRHCVLAAKNLGLDAHDNFLDHTYLGDRTTTIRKYFEAGLGVGIMNEQPPGALRDRYGG